jgi:hypothetical protein
MAVGNQGSKTGLIIAVVVFVILFVTSTIYAIWFNAQWVKAQLVADQEKKKSAQLVNDNDMPDMLQYIQAAKAPKAAFNVIIDERNALAGKITAAPATGDPTVSAEQAADVALQYAKQRVDTNKLAAVPADLTTAVRNFADVIVTLNNDKVKAQADAKAAADSATAATSERDAMLKAKDDQIAQVTADKDKAVADAADYHKAKDGDIDQIKQDADTKVKELQDAATKMQTEQAKLEADNKEKVKTIASLEDRLRSMRINPNESVIQQADGRIIQIPSQNTVFVDIGQKQGVVLGLTFEVYDKEKGIPALGDGMRAEDMPVGKASIEVIHVLPASSECRVIRHTPGESLTEGDLIMNLVFDPNTHYKFMVYGNFDLTNEGTPNAADTDVIKRLVTQWGGRLVDQVDVNTDFVVLGTEPEVPVLSQDDQNDPTKVQKRDSQQAALDAYLDVQSKAVQLGIPLMNQNRFLYFVGYYDQATR